MSTKEERQKQLEDRKKKRQELLEMKKQERLQKQMKQISSDSKRDELAAQFLCAMMANGRVNPLKMEPEYVADAFDLAEVFLEISSRVREQKQPQTQSFEGMRRE